MRFFAILSAISAIAPLASAATAGAAPTFNKDIAPILYQNCATCHRPGEVAPFPLLTYADAAKGRPALRRDREACDAAVEGRAGLRRICQ